jgi:hypothetical protein
MLAAASACLLTRAAILPSWLSLRLSESSQTKFKLGGAKIESVLLF